MQAGYVFRDMMQRGRTQEQDKHSNQELAKPFGDRSTDLWNTLSTWLQALVNGEVAPEKTRFLMVTNKTLNDCLAKRIGNAENSEGIGACIAELEKIGESPSETIEIHVKTVLQPTSRPYLIKLIKNCELSDASDNSSGVDLRKKTVSALQIPISFAARFRSRASTAHEMTNVVLFFK
jgi:hypothetical protein